MSAVTASSTGKSRSDAQQDALGQVRFKAVIDALNFRADKAPIVPKRQFIHAHGLRGFPVQDPIRSEIELLADYPLCYLEVAIDAWPKKSVLPQNRLALLKSVSEILGSGIYPMDGAGMSKSVRTFGVKGPKGATNRKPEFNLTTGEAETLYFGDRDKPSMMKIYLKKFDRDAELPRSKYRIRVELTLELEGLQLNGIEKVGDLLALDFRKAFGSYFRFIKPTSTPISKTCALYRTRLNKGRRAMFDLIDKRRRQAHEELFMAQILKSGAHALHDYEHAATGANASDAVLNRMVKRSLDRIL